MAIDRTEPGMDARIQPAYRAFPLRCWQEAGAGSAGKPAWRFTLVHQGGGQVQHGFACLEEETEYLQQVLSHAQPSSEPTSSRGQPEC